MISYASMNFITGIVVFLVLRKPQLYRDFSFISKKKWDTIMFGLMFTMTTKLDNSYLSTLQKV